jgi:hypothetical protein
VMSPPCHHGATKLRNAPKFSEMRADRSFSYETRQVPGFS